VEVWPFTTLAYQILTASGGQSARQVLQGKGRPAVICPTCLIRHGWRTTAEHVKHLIRRDAQFCSPRDRAAMAALAASMNANFRFLTKLVLRVICGPLSMQALCNHLLLRAEKYSCQNVDRLHQGVDRHPRDHQSCKSFVPRQSSEAPRDRFSRSDRHRGILAARGGGDGCLKSLYIFARRIGWKKLYYGKRLPPEERMPCYGAPHVRKTSRSTFPY